ncbi:hypothetical protein HZR84_02730 [Hyphobacterium sp. CCMP332]|nr:hypothetical protein HZR84_02730 [Hyphobacterium sp. CCMP332]
MRQLVFIAFFLVFSLESFAQSFEFRVLANRGDNTVKTKGTSEWKPIRTGSTLFAGSEIKLSEGGYIGMMHKSGKTMEIKTPQVHDIDALSKNVLTKGSSVASQYGEFLIAKMSTSDDSDVSASKLNNLNVTGAVSRAAGDDADIQMFIPKTSRVLNFDDAIIKWKSIDDVSTYKLEIQNLYSETVARKETESNWYDLSKLQINLAEEGGLFLMVTGSGMEEVNSQPYAIEMLTGAEKEKVEQNLNKLKTEIQNEEHSLQKLILAMFYEENKLYLHAFSCYNEILTEYPNEDFYKSIYLDFVERNKNNF